MFIALFLVGFLGGMITQEGIQNPSPNEIIVHVYNEDNGFNKVCK